MSKTQFNKLNLLLKEVEDPYVQENFYRLKLFLENFDAGDDTYNIVNNIVNNIINNATAVAATKLRVQRIAQEAITASDVVSAASATHAALATADTIREDAMVLGIAENSALTGETVDVVLLGVITDPIFSIFTLNDTLFLDVDGGITNVKRTTGYHVPVGKALGGNDILFQVTNPTVIA